MHGLVVIEGMTLSGHPWIINEIMKMGIRKNIHNMPQGWPNTGFMQ